MERWDAGVCLIDLAARLVAVQSTYSQPGPMGGVEIVIDDKRREVIPYHLADDWLFRYDVETWEGFAEERAKARRASPPLDARAVLYGKVCEFLVPAVADAVAAHAKEGGTDKEVWKRVSDVHARWLTTPREDLRGRAPRDVLLERRKHLSWDLQDRCEQWSILHAPPQPLSKSSHAYLYGGFGTHEIVLYYYLVRFLLDAYWDRLTERPGKTDPAAEVVWLDGLRDAWLNSPNLEIVHGRTPASVIDRERVRLPEAMTGAEAVVDHDCPMCRAMADLPGPMFWHLDGCNMDEGFAFSFHRTLEEWEAQEREYEEMSRQMDERRAAEQAASPWKTSYAGPYAFDGSPQMAVYALAGHLGELVQNLKEAGATPGAIEALNRGFDNVREVSSPLNTDLLEPVVERMCETLADLADRHPSVATQAENFERLLRRFGQRQTAPPEPEDLPF